MKVIVNVLVIRDGKILMVQEAQKHCYGLWNFPAGHLDQGENIFDAARREAKEETGFDVELTGLIGVQNISNANNDKFSHLIHIIFAADIVGGDIAYDPEEILDVKFFDVEQVLNMDQTQLRGMVERKEIIRRALSGVVFPLDVVTNFVRG
jgi:ADP-ribose pyrophosphatase YjhB (NUDIX family)